MNSIKKIAILTFLISTMLGCNLLCGNRKEQVGNNTPYRISDIIIYYSPSIRPYCLADDMTIEDFLSLSNIQKQNVTDSAIFSLFQKIITTSEKDTLRFVRDTIVIEDIFFDYATEQTIKSESREEYKGIVDEYCYWENGPSPCYVVELVSNLQIDTLIIPTAPPKVQFNNTVFNDSTLFYTVTYLICKNDIEWAKGIPSFLTEYRINTNVN